MCLAIPMQVRRIDGYAALCSARGSERRVSLILLHDEELTPGDWVLVHSGQARSRISADDAGLAWAAFDELLEGADLPD